MLYAMQVLLNGRKQHVFQSATRATARLNLLSPAVFPLPFGARVLPHPAVCGKDAKEEQEAGLPEEAPVQDAAATAAAASLASVTDQAQHAQHAQHAQQVSPTARAEAAVAAVQMGLDTRSSRHAKHAQHGPAESDLPDSQLADRSESSPSQDMLVCQHGTGATRQASFKAGSKRQRVTAEAGKACDSAHVVGPVVKLLGDSSGFVRASKEESEVQSQSLGK